MEIIGIANLKGGSGKTTLSINLALQLVNMGFKTLVCDLDANNNSTDFFLRKIDPNSIEQKSILKVLTRQLSLKECIFNTEFDVDVIPATVSLNGLDAAINGNPAPLLAFRSNLSKTNYDYVILDCPPHASQSLRAGIYTSDWIFSPVVGSRWTFQGVQYLDGEINDAKLVTHRDIDLLLIPSMVTKGKLELSKIESIRKSYDVSETIIHRSPALSNMANHGKAASNTAKASDRFKNLAKGDNYMDTQKKAEDWFDQQINNPRAGGNGSLDSGKVVSIADNSKSDLLSPVIEYVNATDLIPNPLNDFPSLPDVELQDLKKDIAQNGILDPLIVKQDNVLITGANRLIVVLELIDEGKTELSKLPVRYITGNLSADDEYDLIEGDNLLRRHLTPEQRKKRIVARIKRLYPDELLKENRGGKRVAKINSQFLPEKNNLAEEVSKTTGIPKGTAQHYIRDAKKQLKAEQKPEIKTIPKSPIKLTIKQKQKIQTLKSDLHNAKQRMAKAESELEIATEKLKVARNNYTSIEKETRKYAIKLKNIAIRSGMADSMKAKREPDSKRRFIADLRTFSIEAGLCNPDEKIFKKTYNFFKPRFSEVDPMETYKVYALCSAELDEFIDIEPNVITYIQNCYYEYDRKGRFERYCRLFICHIDFILDRFVAGSKYDDRPVHRAEIEHLYKSMYTPGKSACKYLNLHSAEYPMIGKFPAKAKVLREQANNPAKKIVNPVDFWITLKASI